MNFINKKLIACACAISTSLVLLGCGSEEAVVDIVDSIDTQYQANVSYVNMSHASLTFYTKSSVYPNSTYDDQHRVTEVVPFSGSNEIAHEWIDGANQTRFAFENTNSGSDRTSATFDLVHNKANWAIGWVNNQSHHLSLVEKSTANQADKYAVRIFTNADLAIHVNQQPGDVAETESGVISSFFSVDVCTDLVVGEHPINLCQSANVGNSYLIFLDDQTGDYIIAQE